MLRLPEAFLVLFCVSVGLNCVAATPDGHLELDDAEVQKAIRFLYQSIARDPADSKENGNCDCSSGSSCGCCARMSVPKIGIDYNACVNVTFLSEQIGAKLVATFNGKVVYSATVSVHNPKPICIKLKNLASACIDLYKLSVSDRAFSGCSKIEVKVAGKVVSTVDLGCFRIPFHVDVDSPVPEPNPQNEVDVELVPSMESEADIL